MPAFLYQGNSARLRLAAARHHPSIHNDRLIEDGAETIADHVTVGREPFVDSHANNGSGRQGQRLREHRLVRLPLGLRVRLSLGLRVRLLQCRSGVRLPLGLRIRGWGGRLDFCRADSAARRPAKRWRRMPVLNRQLSEFLTKLPVFLLCHFGES